VKRGLIEKSRKTATKFSIFAENAACCGKRILAPAIPLGKKRLSGTAQPALIFCRAFYFFEQAR